MSRFFQEIWKPISGGEEWSVKGYEAVWSEALNGREEGDGGNYWAMR
jgi:hypothetical protein